MNELITTFTGNLNGESQSLVNARDLHAFLGVGKDFSNWIKDRIENYRFKEGLDFSPILAKSMFGRPKTEYHISLRMAEHLGLMENNERGDQIREYFIRVEQLARREIPAYLRRDADSPKLAVSHQFLLASNPKFAKLKKYFEAGLKQVEMAKLLDISTDAVRRNLRKMAACGLVNYNANPALVAAGKLGNFARLGVSHAH